MKYLSILILVLLGLQFTSCSDDGDPVEPSISECLQTMIDDFKVDQATCENATIIKYKFQEQEVYAFTQGICVADGGTDVLLDDCSRVCFLGGIAGFQDCNGDLFFDVAEEVEIIWENK